MHQPITLEGTLAADPEIHPSLTRARFELATSRREAAYPVVCLGAPATHVVARMLREGRAVHVEGHLRSGREGLEVVCHSLHLLGRGKSTNPPPVAPEEVAASPVTEDPANSPASAPHPAAA